MRFLNVLASLFFAVSLMLDSATLVAQFPNPTASPSQAAATSSGDDLALDLLPEERVNIAVY